MDTNKKNNNIIILSVILVVAIIAAAFIFSRRKETTAETAAENTVETAADQAAEPAAENTADNTKALTPYWTPDSPVAQSLRDYVSKVTDPADTANFIPVKDRIAVFDMDGTLTCETYYTYYDTMMFIEFCLNDHPERVSDE